MPDKPYVHEDAVHFDVPLDGKPTPVVIPREVLTDHFQAEDHPEGWIAAFTENRDAIEAKALEALAKAYSNPLILGTQLFFS
jgi:hypothetical protein